MFVLIIKTGIHTTKRNEVATLDNNYTYSMYVKKKEFILNEMKSLRKLSIFYILYKKRINGYNISSQ